eukprot:jgi/Psemu1/42578/gm1.42578_g
MPHLTAHSNGITGKHTTDPATLLPAPLTLFHNKPATGQTKVFNTNKMNHVANHCEASNLLPFVNITCGQSNRTLLRVVTNFVVMHHIPSNKTPISLIQACQSSTFSASCTAMMNSANPYWLHPVGADSSTIHMVSSTLLTFLFAARFASTMSSHSSMRLASYSLHPLFLCGSSALSNECTPPHLLPRRPIYWLSTVTSWPSCTTSALGAISPLSTKTATYSPLGSQLFYYHYGNHSSATPNPSELCKALIKDSCHGNTILKSCQIFYASFRIVPDSSCINDWTNKENDPPATFPGSFLHLLTSLWSLHISFLHNTLLIMDNYISAVFALHWDPMAQARIQMAQYQWRHKPMETFCAASSYTKHQTVAQAHLDSLNCGVFEDDEHPVSGCTRLGILPAMLMQVDDLFTANAYTEECLLVGFVVNSRSMIICISPRRHTKTLFYVHQEAWLCPNKMASIYDLTMLLGLLSNSFQHYPWGLCHIIPSATSSDGLSPPTMGQSPPSSRPASHGSTFRTRPPLSGRSLQVLINYLTLGGVCSNPIGHLVPRNFTFNHNNSDASHSRMGTCLPSIRVFCFLPYSATLHARTKLPWADPAYVHINTLEKLWHSREPADYPPAPILHTSCDNRGAIVWWMKALTRLLLGRNAALLLASFCKDSSFGCTVDYSEDTPNTLANSVSRLQKLPLPSHTTFVYDSLFRWIHHTVTTKALNLLLALYASHLLSGHSLLCKTICTKTTLKYLQAASTFLTHFDHDAGHDARCHSSLSHALCPKISAIIKSVKQFESVPNMYKPFTIPMLLHFQQQHATANADTLTWPASGRVNGAESVRKSVFVYPPPQPSQQPHRHYCYQSLYYCPHWSHIYHITDSDVEAVLQSLARMLCWNSDSWQIYTCGIHVLAYQHNAILNNAAALLPDCWEPLSPTTPIHNFYGPLQCTRCHTTTSSFPMLALFPRISTSFIKPFPRHNFLSSSSTLSCYLYSTVAVVCNRDVSLPSVFRLLICPFSFSPFHFKHNPCSLHFTMHPLELQFHHLQPSTMLVALPGLYSSLQLLLASITTFLQLFPLNTIRWAEPTEDILPHTAATASVMRFCSNVLQRTIKGFHITLCSPQLAPAKSTLIEDLLSLADNNLTQLTCPLPSAHNSPPVPLSTTLPAAAFAPAAATPGALTKPATLSPGSRKSLNVECNHAKLKILEGNPVDLPQGTRIPGPNGANSFPLKVANHRIMVFVDFNKTQFEPDPHLPCPWRYKWNAVFTHKYSKLIGRLLANYGFLCCYAPNTLTHLYNILQAYIAIHRLLDSCTTLPPPTTQQCKNPTALTTALTTLDLVPAPLHPCKPAISTIDTNQTVKFLCFPFTNSIVGNNPHYLFGAYVLVAHLLFPCCARSRSLLQLCPYKCNWLETTMFIRCCG